MKEIKVLNKIIKSSTPLEDFYKEYKRESFKNFIDNFLPEIPKCIELDQKNIWHVYKVFDHILVALTKANELSKTLSKTNKKRISYAVFFHDIGKPDSVVEKVKNGEISYGFPCHNIKSIEIFSRVENAFSLTSYDKTIIKLLIEHHDMFNGLTVVENNKDKCVNKQFVLESINLVKDKVKRVKDFYKSLLIVVKSDNFAQNTALTKGTLIAAQKFEKLLNKA